MRQFLAAESPLNIMKNASKNLSFRHSGHVTKRLDKKDKVNFKCYDITARLTSNCNTHIAQYLEK